MDTRLKEIPPRARRRVIMIPRPYSGCGNTSACAEKSFRRSALGIVPWKYLRVRGEESLPVANLRGNGEIPPRARRRGRPSREEPCRVGNTSACAEKRAGQSRPKPNPWKYLRVRGEEHPTPTTRTRIKEIPPRARRRDAKVCASRLTVGNTSACAEKRGRHQGWIRG